MSEYSIERFDHVGITVSDMGRALRFFGEILGARTIEPFYRDDPVIGRVSGITNARLTIAYAWLGAHAFELLQYHHPAERRRSDLRPCDDGHIHLGLRVRGIEALAARMDVEGFRAAGPIQRGVGANNMSATYMCGFDNLVVELIEEAPAH